MAWIADLLSYLHNAFKQFTFKAFPSILFLMNILLFRFVWGVKEWGLKRLEFTPQTNLKKQNSQNEILPNYVTMIATIGFIQLKSLINYCLNWPKIFWVGDNSFSLWGQIIYIIACKSGNYAGDNFSQNLISTIIALSVYIMYIVHMPYNCKHRPVLQLYI